MKKWIALIAVLLLLVALFAGCKPTASPDSSVASGSDVNRPQAPSSSSDISTSRPADSNTDIATPSPTKSAG